MILFKPDGAFDYLMLLCDYGCMNQKAVEFYVSVDIEATGPIPGMYSMSAVGASLAAIRYSDGTIAKSDHTREQGFYAELAPITDNYDSSAIMVGLLEGFEGEDTPQARHAWQEAHGEDPQISMTRFAKWVNEIKNDLGGAKPVFAAYPLGFDWGFTHWYFVTNGVDDPFGFSSAIDMKSLFSTKWDRPIAKSTKRYMPKHLLKSDVPHTHHALDDAIGQGDMLYNMLAA